MEKEYRLTKEKLDSVRDIEGFPMGEDEDIISLSNPPYYTACPNPFIKDFIENYGKKYDETTDDYHREPFAADVSEGRNESLYMVHSYHTKVPYKAIMRYILHYTDPGDIIYDGFCGSGMTGVAAQMCGNPDDDFKEQINSEMDVEWGSRKAILSDLSPAASFIANNYTSDFNPIEFEKEFNDVINECEKEYGWMYKTGKDKILFTVWSDVMICPNCSNEHLYWDEGIDWNTKNSKREYKCPDCKINLKKNSFIKKKKTYYDKNELFEISEQIPVLINYEAKGKRINKEPNDDDLNLLKKIEETEYKYFFPNNRMTLGKESRRNDKHGITHVHQFFTKRNLLVLSCFFEKSKNKKYRDLLWSIMASYIDRSSKRNRYMPKYGSRHVGSLSGTLYIPNLSQENNLLHFFENKARSIVNTYYNKSSKDIRISTNSATNTLITNNSIDYIFIDPPFGSNLDYSELNYIWESWLEVFTNNKKEAIINNVQKKSLVEYQDLMTDSFREYYRVLKPGRWITVEFHNSKNVVWNAIQEALQVVGFVIADIRTLDKKKGTTKQLSYAGTVKQDLIISAYKPKESMIKDFKLKAGTEDSAWSFVREHLSHLPVVVVKNKNIELIAERQAYLLYDRMLAYHIMRGYSIPMDASDFYNGLDEKFIERDGMYFLANQINEYDAVRIKNDVEPIQMEMFVNDEKSAIAWLYKKLEDRKTYQELQPEFMQEVRSIDKREDMPELLTILEENFLKDEDGKWYIPDRSKKGDIEKLRNKNLIKEFESYFETDGKLKIVRTEAVRAGFAKLWNDKDYKSIVDFSERIHESIIQEDDKLLMYYDLSLGRIE